MIAAGGTPSRPPERRTRATLASSRGALPRGAAAGRSRADTQAPAARAHTIPARRARAGREEDHGPGAHGGDTGPGAHTLLYSSASSILRATRLRARSHACADAGRTHARATACSSPTNRQRRARLGARISHTHPPRRPMSGIWVLTNLSSGVWRWRPWRWAPHIPHGGRCQRHGWCGMLRT